MLWSRISWQKQMHFWQSKRPSWGGTRPLQLSVFSPLFILSQLELLLLLRSRSLILDILSFKISITFITSLANFKFNKHIPILKFEQNIYHHLPLMFLPNLLYPRAALPKTSLKPTFYRPLLLQRKNIMIQGKSFKNTPPIIKITEAACLFYWEFFVFSKMCFVSLKWAWKYLPSSNSSFSLYP